MKGHGVGDARGDRDELGRDRHVLGSHRLEERGFDLRDDRLRVEADTRDRGPHRQTGRRARHLGVEGLDSKAAGERRELVDEPVPLEADDRAHRDGLREEPQAGHRLVEPRTSAADGGCLADHRVEIELAAQLGERNVGGAAARA